MEHKKFLATFAAISLIVGCCVMMLLYPLLKGEEIFNPEPAPEEISFSFLSALANDDYQTAFNLCDDLLQEDLIDPQNMQAEIEKNQLQPTNWEILSQSISPDEVEFSGSMDFRIHISGTFRITLRHYENGWKVAVFFLDY